MEKSGRATAGCRKTVKVVDTAREKQIQTAEVLTGLVGEITRLTEKMAGWEDTKKWFTQLIVGWFATSLVGGIVLIYVVEKIMHVTP